jgi:hypothetical protein
MASQLPKHPEAFSLTRGAKKRPREHSEPHLKFIRRLPCVVCGKRDVEAAHIRSGALRHGKPEGATSEKPHDRWSLPLCTAHHREQHSMNELAFYAQFGIDPFVTALALWAETGNEDAAEVIVRESRLASQERG